MAIVEEQLEPPLDTVNMEDGSDSENEKQLFELHNFHRELFEANVFSVGDRVCIVHDENDDMEILGQKGTIEEVIDATEYSVELDNGRFLLKAASDLQYITTDTTTTTMQESVLIESMYQRANMITEYLYLGDMEAATDPQYLQDHQIEYVFTICAQRNPATFRRELYATLEHLYLPLDDWYGEELAPYFEQGLTFITQAISQEKNVLVHCHAGVSRSATFVLAYLMKTNLWDFENAMTFVQDIRWIQPNHGFEHQLRAWGENNYQYDDSGYQECLQSVRQTSQSVASTMIQKLLNGDGYQ